ncbi:hypothetical protein, partial [Anaerostipes sp.]|uniref:hypothetical protein n=1 Tax=Anaerostipes sp. TaxID=1872530 RepID=UPI003FED3E35
YIEPHREEGKDEHGFPVDTENKKWRYGSWGASGKRTLYCNFTPNTLVNVTEIVKDPTVYQMGYLFFDWYHVLC